MSSGEFEIKTESFDIHEEWKIESNPSVLTLQIDGLDPTFFLVKCEPQELYKSCQNVRPCFT